MIELVVGFSISNIVAEQVVVSWPLVYAMITPKVLW
jgi:hypothetical protein